jgi:tetratricopeptide (TPR) repeat protein
MLRTAVTSLRAALAAAWLLALTGPADAAPAFVPTEDGQVLERLPVLPDDGTGALRARLAADPGDLATAIELAQRYATRARLSQDPRWAGYAEATLGPWWASPDPPPPVRLLRAVLRQHRHDFRGALADLDAVVAVAPQTAQAWLAKATVELVVGDPAASLATCERLRARAMRLVTTLCQSAALIRSGRAALADLLLEGAIGDGVELPHGLAAWAWTLRAEAAAFLGHDAIAEDALRRAVAAEPGDAFAILALADHLLERGRAAEVPTLVEGDLQNDGKLLRLVLAERATGLAGADDHARTLALRFAVARSRGDSVAQREEARLVLALGHAAAALRIATENWQVQREPWDARLVLEAALGAGDHGPADPVAAWLELTQIEDPALRSLAAQITTGGR